MDIQLTDKIKIGSDEHNYIIYHSYKDKKTGKLGWNAKYFFPTLSCLVNDLLETEIRESDAKDLKKLANDIEVAKKRYAKLIDSLNK